MLLAAFANKFGRDIPTGILLAGGGADDPFRGPGHQVWLRALCWDAVGQQRRRDHLWRPLVTKFGGGILLADSGTADAFGGPGHQV